jgi:hypothetical protein
MENSGNNKRCIIPATGEDGYEVHARLTSTSLVTSVDLPVGERPVIPIVFIPGIMGTNLYNKKLEEVVWEPGSGLSTLWNFSNIPDAERQEYLDVYSTIVHEGGEIKETITADYWNSLHDYDNIDMGKKFDSKNALHYRGWGALYSSAYHNFMSIMQNNLNSVMHMGKLDSTWEVLMRLPLSSYAMSSSALPLTKEELTKVARFRFEVWGYGYNWLESNETSAQKLKIFILNRVLPHYEKNDRVRLAARKVILVTHSMGGMVARSFIKLSKDNSNLILGVLHGAQPSNGAAETYSNMRQGMRGTLGLVMGSNAGAVGAVLTQCQGGLELLPFGFGTAYNPRPHGTRTPPVPSHLQAALPGIWMFFNSYESKHGMVLRNFAGDVYEDLYKSEKWYGLLPSQNEHHFDPVGIVKEKDPDYLPRKIFEKFIDDVKGFHKKIVGAYHPTTYAFWGSAADTPAIGEILWDWSKNMPRVDDESEYPANPPARDDGRGIYRDDTGSYMLKSAMHLGDGTVPRASWEADLGNPGILAYCCLGASKENSEGFEHQDAFNDRRARSVSLYFLAKLVSRQFGELTP